jgi:hypothetical protein
MSHAQFPYPVRAIIGALFWFHIATIARFSDICN